MPIRFHSNRSQLTGALRQTRRIYLYLIASFCLLAPGLSHAVELGWSITGEDVIYGEVTEFNFDKKTVTIKDSETEKDKTFPSSQLDTRSKWMLMLFTSEFYNSIPQDDFGTEHLILGFVFIAIPVLVYLFSFWLCAIIVTRRINPLRTPVALIGAWLLSGFLIVFYVFMIGKHPDHTMAICIIGGLVTLTVASLFIAIIYHKNIIHGLTLIILHSILAPIILVSAIYLPYKFGDTEQVDTFFEERLFIPVGLLPGQGED